MTRDLEKAPEQAREGILRAIREEIARAIAYDQPLERLFEGAMEPIRRGEGPAPEQAAPVDTEGMSRTHLQFSVRVLTDLMSLEEMRRELSPLRDRYPSFSQVPEEGLKDLVKTLGEKLGGRTTLSFTDRYRSGRMLTQRNLSPDVWTLLPEGEKHRLLSEDNAAMDLTQTARHISRIFMSHEYQMLHDPTTQIGFLNDPFYQALQESILATFSPPAERERLRELNRVVTVRMLEVEGGGPEDRQARLLDLRKAIAAALGLPESLLYPEPGA
jgi:hypothetical protein